MPLASWNHRMLVACQWFHSSPSAPASSEIKEGGGTSLDNLRRAETNKLPITYRHECESKQLSAKHRRFCIIRSEVLYTYLPRACAAYAIAGRNYKWSARSWRAICRQCRVAIAMDQEEEIFLESRRAHIPHTSLLYLISPSRSSLPIDSILRREIEK